MVEPEAVLRPTIEPILAPEAAGPVQEGPLAETDPTPLDTLPGGVPDHAFCLSPERLDDLAEQAPAAIEFAAEKSEDSPPDVTEPAPSAAVDAESAGDPPDTQPAPHAPTESAGEAAQGTSFQVTGPFGEQAAAAGLSSQAEDTANAGDYQQGDPAGPDARPADEVRAFPAADPAVVGQPSSGDPDFDAASENASTSSPPSESHSARLPGAAAHASRQIPASWTLRLWNRSLRSPSRRRLERPASNCHDLL